MTQNTMKKYQWKNYWFGFDYAVDEIINFNCMLTESNKSDNCVALSFSFWSGEKNHNKWVVDNAKIRKMRNNFHSFNFHEFDNTFKCRHCEMVIISSFGS